MVVLTQKILCKTIPNKKNDKRIIQNPLLIISQTKNETKNVKITSTTAILKSLILWTPSPGIPNASLYLQSIL